MACLALACGVLAAALGALCRPRGPNAGLCGPTAPVGHLCKRGTAAGPTLAGWKGADAPRRARRQGAVHGRDPSLRAALVSPLRRAPWWNPRGFANVVALDSTASRAQGATHGAPNSCSRRRSSWRAAIIRHPAASCSASSAARTLPLRARARTTVFLYFQQRPRSTAMRRLSKPASTVKYCLCLMGLRHGPVWRKLPQCLACSSQWGWSGGRRDNSKALHFCQYM